MQFQSFTTKKITPHVGADVNGIDLTQPLSGQQVEDVLQALAQFGVLRFEHQPLDHASLKALGRHFGDLHFHTGVKAMSEHPEITLMGGVSNRFPDSVEIGGLMLCKTPVEFTEQRDAHFRQLAAAQMESVDNNFMRENDPRMPLFKERSTKVTSFGKGT